MQLDHPLGTKYVLAFFAKISARKNYVVATIGLHWCHVCRCCMIYKQIPELFLSLARAYFEVHHEAIA
jgi:hypothetical protein